MLETKYQICLMGNRDHKISKKQLVKIVCGGVWAWGRVRKKWDLLPIASCDPHILLGQSGVGLKPGIVALIELSSSFYSPVDISGLWSRTRCSRAGVVGSWLMGLGWIFWLQWINQSELLFVVSSGEPRRGGRRSIHDREIIIYIIYFKHIVAHWL